jgi:hypothetical protein
MVVSAFRSFQLFPGRSGHCIVSCSAVTLFTLLCGVLAGVCCCNVSAVSGDLALNVVPALAVVSKILTF